MSVIKLIVKSVSSFSPEGLFLNGKEFFINNEKDPFNIFAKAVYYHMAPSYPKFFKMDELCKLAFLSTELLVKDHKLGGNAEGTDTALIIANRDSSVTSDIKHLTAIQDKETFFPSPAVFVYTLPNIMLGEVCIRHQITGENTCFLMDAFDAEFIHQYVVQLFENEDYNKCITGWINFSNENDYYSKLFLIEKNLEEDDQSKEFTLDFFKI